MLPSSEPFGAHVTSSGLPVRAHAFQAGGGIVEHFEVRATAGHREMSRLERPNGIAEPRTTQASRRERASGRGELGLVT